MISGKRRAGRPGVPVDIPLSPLYQRTQAPLRPGNVIPMLGNADLCQLLADQLASPDGGLTVVTGFRGVEESPRSSSARSTS